jgi:hypothetical protein
MGLTNVELAGLGRSDRDGSFAQAALNEALGVARTEGFVCAEHGISPPRAEGLQ